MGLFDRGRDYRLEDVEPEKRERERTVRPYRPPRPLSWLGCGIVLVLSAVLLGFGLTLLALHFTGIETDARVNTRLDEDGAVTEIEVRGMTTAVSYTYRDSAGKLHGGTGSLFGNTAPFEDTIPVRYFPWIPGWHMLAFRTDDVLTPLGSLLLGVLLLSAAVTRLKEIRGKRDPAPGE